MTRRLPSLICLSVTGKQLITYYSQHPHGQPTLTLKQLLVFNMILTIPLAEMIQRLMGYAEVGSLSKQGIMTSNFLDV